jgi:hypothetical protein
MFASHLISAPKRPNEYRVVLLGDSSVWGESLAAHEIISEQWNRFNTQCGTKTIRTYDLGYPHPSLMKDLTILDKVMEYKPDFVIWFVTLNTLMSQRTNPFLDANRERVAKLLNTYDISFKGGKEFAQERPTFYEQTLMGQRSNLAREIKLQMLGFIWTASGQDTNRLVPDAPPNPNVRNDRSFHGMQLSEELTSLMSFDILQAGYGIANRVPLLIVNEPIYISKGKNSSVRYNSFYPRWAYDQYRNILATRAQNAGWNYLDVWNIVPPQYFSDATLHLTAKGEQILIRQANPVLQSIACNPKP